MGIEQNSGKRAGAQVGLQHLEEAGGLDRLCWAEERKMKRERLYAAKEPGQGGVYFAG